MLCHIKINYQKWSKVKKEQLTECFLFLQLYQNLQSTNPVGINLAEDRTLKLVAIAAVVDLVPENK